MTRMLSTSRFERLPHKQRKLTLQVVVTIGILLDWVPSYVFGTGSFLSSGTKLIVIPLIYVDFLRAPKTYLSPGFGWLYTGGVLLGVGGGIISGNLPQSRLISLIPSILILFFYMKRRTLDETRIILTVALWASLAIPVVNILAWVGIAPSTVLVETENFSRMRAGTSWGSFGLLILIIPASLGGLLFLTSASLAKHRRLAIHLLVITVGLVGTLITAQRSSAIIFVVSLILAWLLGTRLRQYRRLLLFFIIAACMVVFLLPYASPDIAEIYDSTIYRLNNPNDQSGTLRLSMIELFVQDLLQTTSIVGIGYSRFTYLIGTGPHFLLGEAYYSGGLLLLVITFLGVMLAGVKLAAAWLKVTDSETKAIVLVLLVIYLGYLAQVSTHTTMTARVGPMFLGLFLSVDSLLDLHSRKGTLGSTRATNVNKVRL